MTKTPEALSPNHRDGGVQDNPITNEHDALITINRLAQQYWHDPAALMNRLKQTSSPLLEKPIHPTTYKSILLFFHSLGIGGGERVTCELAKLWQSMGMHVTIVTDVALNNSELGQTLPKGVQHRTIPDYMQLTGDSYTQRSAALRDIIAETKADTMVFAHWFAESLPYDLLLCRAYGLQTHIYIQSCFSLFFLDDVSSYLIDLPRCYSLANSVICLSETDRFIWSQFSDSVFATYNPITIELPKKPARLQGHTILWPARLHPDKCPERVIPIMQELVQLVPDAVLQMVGPVSDQTKDELLQLADTAGIKDHIAICGERAPEDMQSFYENADAFLMTSRREGWPLALTEALAYGLPCVMYDLPYLTLVTNNPAVISVAQDDYVQTAYALANVLLNKQEALRLGAQSHTFIQQMYSYDFSAFWTKIFSGSRPQDTSSDKQTIEVCSSYAIHESFNAHREYVARSHSNLVRAHQIVHDQEKIIRDIESTCDQLHQRIEQLETSYSFRAGRALTYIPRKMRAILRRI